MPDVNIHLKTKGAEDTRRKLKLVAGSTREMETETKKASTGMLSSLKSIGGALGFAGLATTAIAAIRKIILALDDMKKAVSETVQELASQQKAAADYFEAMSAYTPASRRKALGQARSFQGKTGLDFDSSKNLLEAYQRTFGQIDTEATEQFAGYQQLHGGTATPDLIRWMGASGVEGKKRQGQIMRMVSATAEQTGLRDDEIIRGVTQYSTEFREFGWTPEQAIENVGRVMSGLTRKEARRAMSGLVEGLKTFDEEKALEYGAPEDVAASDQLRIEWAQKKIQQATPNERRRLAGDMFGKTYGAYVTKYMLGEMAPESRQALQYAQTEEAAEAEHQRVLAYRETAEGKLERAKGTAGQFGLIVSDEEKSQTVLRKYGADYLNYLRRNDRLKYEKIKALGLGKEKEKELAAKELWQTTQPKEGFGESLTDLYMPGGPVRTETGWDDLTTAEQVGGVEKATTTIINNNYSSDINLYPTAGSDPANRNPGQTRTGDI